MEAGVGVDGELFVGLEWKGFTGGVIAGLKSVRLDVNCPAASLPVTQIRELLVGGELPKRCPGIGLRLHDWQGNGLGVQQIVVRLEVDFGPAPTSIAPGYTGKDSVVYLSRLRSLVRIRRLDQLAVIEQCQIRIRTFRSLALRERPVAQQRLSLL